ncbi:MAG: TIGR04372 family glycosyltransferase, partial [Burkholderiales bacterium]
EALLLYATLLDSHPDHANAWNNTGLAMLDLQRKQEARRCFEQTLKLAPNHDLASLNLGAVQKEFGALHEAIATYRAAIVHHPLYSDLHLNLGAALNGLGRTGEAVESLRKAIQIKPDNATAYSSLIFTLDYDTGCDTRAQQQIRRDWYDRCVVPLGIKPLDVYTKPDAGKRLRVGYVSADLRRTSAAMCFAPLLLHFDRQGFEVFCYSNSVTEDEVTARIRASVTTYRSIAGLTDEEAAQAIAADKVDILVDLSGHSRGHRLNVFAYRPAPLQITAWGYANGTGMPEMDYMLADAVYLPEQDLKWFAERRVDVPAVIPYCAFDALPPVCAPPCASQGEITFGSFSRFQKVTTASIKLWARILAAVPNSRLLLKSSEEVDGEVRAQTEAEFRRLGVDPRRIQVLARSSWSRHMESFGEIDIQLDPIPHGGGVSLLDGIVMGVPCVVLHGVTPAGRLGSSLLQALGFGWESIAKDEDEYVALAVKYASNLEKSIAARAGLRERLLGSVVGDPQKYARAVENTYREVWRRQCEILEKKRDRWIEQAKAALHANKTEVAIPLLERIANADEEDTQAFELAGAAAYQLRNYSLAHELLEKAVLRPGASPDAYINLGIVRTVLRQYDQAIETLRAVIGKHPTHVEAYYNLGCVLLGQRCYKEAVETLQRARDLAPKSGKILNNLGVAYESQDNLSQAWECFERASISEPNYALSHANLGRLALGRSEDLKAIEYFKRALDLDGHLYWVRSELAALYERLGMHAGLPALAEVRFTKVAKMPPRSPAPEDSGQTMARIARLEWTHMREERQPKQAIEEALLKQAGRLMELDHPGKINVLREIIEIDPDCLPAYTQLGIAHHHDERCDLAGNAWARGLRRRDALAKQAGLENLPHRVLDASWYMAVGHMQMLDIYLKSTAMGHQPARDLWLLRLGSRKIPNPHYLQYWRPWLREAPMDNYGDNWDSTANAVGVTREQLALVTDHFFAVRESSEREFWHMEYACKVQREWESRNGDNLITLSAEDRDFGMDVLGKLGVPEGAWYVCLHVREPGFWWQWDRHHPSIRNARIETYHQAIGAIVERGGTVIRMGDKSMRPLEAKPGVIDYAHSEHKSERMDVFLAGSCRLFIGVNSGLSLLPPTFGVPCLLTNFTPISIPFPYGKDRMLPKLFRSKRDGRLLCFDAMFKHGVAHSQFAKNVPSWAEVVDNDPRDIAQAAVEMLEESQGALSSRDKERFAELRNRYDEILRRNGVFLGSPLGGRFLERHEQLLHPWRTERKRA